MFVCACVYECLWVYVLSHTNFNVHAVHIMADYKQIYFASYLYLYSNLNTNCVSPKLEGYFYPIHTGIGITSYLAVTYQI